ncbi:MAG: polyhydroxyalkanoic acid synthase [Rhizobacter sp.]|nr:polyhydroxyalkanoic acid synthase [Rhizobacter sp.]
MPSDPTRTAPPRQPLDLPLTSWIARLSHGISPPALAAAFEDWRSHLVASPGKQAELAESALHKYWKWWAYVQASALGGCPPCETPAPHDKRFKAPQWQSAPYNWLAQGFLLSQSWWKEATTGVRGVSRHHEDVVEFVARQWLDMCSPSNFVLGNPQVLDETVTSGGRNLATGLANWWRDAMAVASDSPPPGAEHFRPGEAVALTPGKVVFRNRLIELIRYDPQTPTVYPEPVMIVPSWIMKYYILDLSPANSMVKYLVDQGHTVFMVSWKNPDGHDRDLGMDDYLQLGVLDAVAVVQQHCPRVGVHAVGYCLGGTLMAVAAAALARRKPSPLKTVSLLAAQIDFEEPGELGLFIDESQIAFLEDLMSQRGYLDGRQMAGAFALINSKDLVWSKLVHEYLMGARTPLNDLRAWNADATRMPERMHSEYLRWLYLDNDLAEGRYRALGEPVVTQDIRQPLFCVATERDHVSPWQSVYKVHLLTDTELTFVLTTGGHNVGIVNPPEGPAASPEASHRVAVRRHGDAYVDPATWAATAEQRPGSWWPTWQHWLSGHSGQRRAPRFNASLPVLGDAPGDYVHGL